MKGYVAKKGDRWYAVIYEGVEHGTGKERRSWHPAGTRREEVERPGASNESADSRGSGGVAMSVMYRY